MYRILEGDTSELLENEINQAVLEGFVLVQIVPQGPRKLIAVMQQAGSEGVLGVPDGDVAQLLPAIIALLSDLASLSPVANTLLDQLSGRASIEVAEPEPQ